MIRTTKIRMAGAAALLALATGMPTQEAAAQDAIGGAIIGGALGGLIGGAATGRAGGAAVGAIIGGATGALIGAEAERRRSGYYWWRGGCYYRYPDGGWAQVQRRYC